MKKWILATAAIAVFGQVSAVAPVLAQGSTSGTPMRNTQQPAAGGVPQAPIGHRQPTRSDVPSESGKNNPDNIGNVDAQDKQLDRMIKGICKGC